jgi:hypothetical protein
MQFDGLLGTFLSKDEQDGSCMMTCTHCQVFKCMSDIGVELARGCYPDRQGIRRRF